ncbi:uncharacterized protein LOC106938649 isoform X1 [Poecilia latipinna]|uniref:uncharacterized protein LOC106938649 isoform X1 n=1 Tax=Poecilia latipinna TaxID=48699 RepID=UPI00072EAE16|nr:PREDICTED: uncharacterized protein LOC106938649 isoform X1 [Poecilia latipinna]
MVITLLRIGPVTPEMRIVNKGVLPKLFPGTTRIISLRSEFMATSEQTGVCTLPLQANKHSPTTAPAPHKKLAKKPKVCPIRATVFERGHLKTTRRGGMKSGETRALIKKSRDSSSTQNPMPWLLQCYKTTAVELHNLSCLILGQGPNEPVRDRLCYWLMVIMHCDCMMKCLYPTLRVSVLSVIRDTKCNKKRGADKCASGRREVCN